MLKLFYKTLLVSVISGSLLMLNLNFDKSFVSFNSAKAEQVTTTAKDSQQEDLFSTLTMLGIGVVTSRLYKCKLTTDMMLAAAGGVAFLAGEVTSYKFLQKNIENLDKQIERDSTGRPTQAQIDLLKRLNDSYKDAKKTAEEKKSYQEMAQIVFLTATVVAGYQAATETTTQSTCAAGLITAQEAAAMVCAATVSTNTCCTFSVPVLLDSASRKAKIAADLVTGQSAAKNSESKGQAATIQTEDTTSTVTCAAAGAYMTAACKPGDILDLVTKGFCSVPPSANLSFLNKVLYANVNYTPIVPVHRSNFFENIFDHFLLQSAHADIFSAFGVASSAAVAFLMSTSGTLGYQLDMFMFSPFNRAIVWGVLGGLTNASINSTQKQIDKLQDNIDKIDKIINYNDNLANGTSTGIAPNNSTTSSTIGSPPGSAPSSTPASVNLGGALPCITGGTPGNCPSFSTTLNGLPNVAIPDFVQQQINDIAKVTDGINGAHTISGGTLAGVANLGGQSNAIRAEIAKQQKAMQTAVGNKIDIAKVTAGLTNDLKAIVQKELDNKKTTAGAMYASFGGGKFSSAVATDANKEKTKEVKKSLAAIPVVAIPAAIAPKIDDSELQKGLAKDDKAPEEAAVKAASMDQYELKNDITKDKGVSIFELISNRYRNSGYPRLFKKLKE